MSTRTRWQSSATRWRLDGARVRLGNAWYRAVGRRISGTRTGFSNWRNRRTLQRGRRDAAARLGDQVRSRTPVLRARINPATGWPHRDDRKIGRAQDQSLSRRRALREFRATHPAAIPARAADNQRHVRARLASRQPQYARTLDRAVRDLSPRSGRSR
jgi:hypothetical protein